MSQDRERALDEQISALQMEVLDLDHRLRHEREKLADIELFIAGGSLDPMRPASYRLVRLGLANFRLNRFSRILNCLIFAKPRFLGYETSSR